MNLPGPARALRLGFTVIEMVVATAILSMLMVMFAVMLSQTNQAWTTSQQRLENFQNGRAILEIMARELAPAAISKGLQFVQNPATSGQTDLHTLLPTTATPAITQAANSDSLFWARPSTPNSFGNIYETGYFLTTVASTPKRYELVRFNMAPGYIATSQTTQKDHGGATASANTSTYWIYDPPTAYNPLYAVTTSWPEYTDAPWLTTLSAANFQASYSVVSDGVIAFWIRCLDKNGDPIPWLYQSSLYSSVAPFNATATTPNLKFNSAASFTPATPGVSSSFAYTAPPTIVYYSTLTNAAVVPSGTLAANRLPSAVELTIVTLDSRTLARNPTLPTVPAATSATDVPTEIQNFMNSLVAANIKTAKVFSTTVRLVNGTD